MGGDRAGQQTQGAGSYVGSTDNKPVTSVQCVEQKKPGPVQATKLIERVNESVSR